MVIRVNTIKGAPLDWKQVNPVLSNGEIGVDAVDNLLKFKIGDGINDFESLPQGVVSGAWETPYAEYIEVNENFRDGLNHIDTGVVLEDASEYHIVVSAVDGEFVANGNSGMWPCIISDYDFHNISESPGNGLGISFNGIVKARYQFRWQVLNSRTSNYQYAYASSLFDELIGNCITTSEENNLEQILINGGLYNYILPPRDIADPNNQLAQSPKGTQYKIIFVSTGGLTSANDMGDITYLLKVERRRGVPTL